MGKLLSAIAFIQICLIYLLLHFLSCIGLMSKVFTSGPGDQVSVPGRVLKKVVLDAALLSIRR